jgi:hypothetical protein
MRDNINEDSNVDADTSLADLDISRINNIRNDVNTGKIEVNNDDEPSLFAANNLLSKTADNLARAEAMVDEKPLRTEKTSELENDEESDDTDDDDLDDTDDEESEDTDDNESDITEDNK